MKIDGIYTSEKDSWQDLARRYYGSDAVIRLDEGYIDFSRSSYRRINHAIEQISYNTYLKVQHQCRRNEPSLARLYFKDDISCIILHGRPGKADDTVFDLKDVLLYTVSGKDEIHLAGSYPLIALMDQNHALYDKYHAKDYLTVLGLVCRYMKVNRSGHPVLHYGILSEEGCIHVSRIDQILPCPERESVGEMICMACPLKRACGNSREDLCPADNTWYRNMFRKFLQLYLMVQEEDHGTV
jgi:hypothetical protein